MARLITVFMLVLGACAPVARIQKGKACKPRPEDQSARLYGLNIVGGEAVADDDRHGQSTVGLLLPIPINGTLQRAFVCSAVVVADDLLVTAAHCLKHVTVESEANPNHRMQIHFAASVTGSTPATHLRNATAFLKHPGYSGTGQSDIGWVKFAGGLPEGFRKVKVLTDLAPLVKGKPVAIVGYGSSATAASATIGQRRIATTFVDSIINSTVNGQFFSNLLRLVDLDPATGQRLVRGACFGDSGGPAFVTTASTLASLKVVGVTQGTIRGINQIPADRTRSCESGDANYTLIAPFIPWILDTSGVDLTPPALAPKVNITGQPSGDTSEPALNVRVNGEGEVVSYRFALLDGEEDCSRARYSEFVPIERPITDRLTTPGKKRLCVVGRNTEDSLTAAESASWNHTVSYAGQIASAENGTRASENSGVAPPAAPSAASPAENGCP